MLILLVYAILLQILRIRIVCTLPPRMFALNVNLNICLKDNPLQPAIFMDTEHRIAYMPNQLIIVHSAFQAICQIMLIIRIAIY